MLLFNRLSFTWGGNIEGDDVRFHVSDYRAGGPWMTQRIVHDVTRRYGLGIRTQRGWLWLGVMVLANQRLTIEASPARVDPIAHASV